MSGPPPQIWLRPFKINSRTDKLVTSGWRVKSKGLSVWSLPNWLHKVVHLTFQTHRNFVILTGFWQSHILFSIDFNKNQNKTIYRPRWQYKPPSFICQAEKEIWKSVHNPSRIITNYHTKWPGIYTRGFCYKTSWLRWKTKIIFQWVLLAK